MSTSGTADHQYDTFLFSPRLAQVTTERWTKIAKLIDAGELKTEVGEVVWLDEARQGHDMLEGAPHRRGKLS